MYSLILNMPFVSLNEYIKQERTNKFKAAKIKEQQTNCVAFLAIEQRFKIPVAKYDVELTWYKPNNRKDHDNIAFAIKFVLDGLVLSRVLKSDTPKHINNISHKFEIDKTRNYVSCKIVFKPKY